MHSPPPEAKPRILVPLAHAAAAPLLGRAAAKLAERLDAEIILLHVVDVPLLTQIEQAARRKDEAAPLFELARASIPATTPIRTEVRLGHLVGLEIRNAARELKADVMLVGWRREFPLKSLVVGTLRPVLGRPPCDVLILDLDRKDALESVMPLPIPNAGEIGLQIIASAAAAHATGILIHEPASRSRAEASQRRERIRALAARMGEWVPEMAVDVVVEAFALPLHRLVERAGRVFLVLVSPLSPRSAPRVRARARDRRARPLVMLVGG